jgi:hypothetical protein
MSAQTDAYVQKKPKHIIQNQTLIELLMVSISVSTFSLIEFLFWFTFCVAPTIIIPSLLITWAVGSVSYIVMRLHVQRQNKKESHI